MKQKIRIEICVDTSKPVPLNEFKDRFIETNKNLAKEVVSETGTKINCEGLSVTVGFATKSYDRWRKSGQEPEFSFDW